MPMSTVAVCCDDLGLMADARRACAAAGLEVELVGWVDARRWWPRAAAVLVDVEAGAQICAQTLPRRAGVALLTRAEDPEVWRLAVSLGAEQVAVLPADERGLLRGVLAGRAAGHAPVVACVPASGGAGASTLAAALALTSARSGASTFLVDGDPAGGGLDLLLGLERAEGMRWPDVESGWTQRGDGRGLDALIRPTPRLRLLSWDRRGPQASAPTDPWPLVAASRAEVELVVVDLPRQFEAFDPGAVDVVLLVSRADVRQAVAATQAATRLRAAVDDLRLVVRGGRRGGLSPTDVAAAVGVPLALSVREDRRLVNAADDGQQLRRLLARWPLDRLLASLLPSARRAA
jgi:secretion/DNA translocation related CpaE-like protein